MTFEVHDTEMVERLNQGNVHMCFFSCSGYRYNSMFNFIQVSFSFLLFLGLGLGSVIGLGFKVRVRCSGSGSIT